MVINQYLLFPQACGGGRRRLRLPAADGDRGQVDRGVDSLTFLVLGSELEKINVFEKHSIYLFLLFNCSPKRTNIFMLA